MRPKPGWLRGTRNQLQVCDGTSFKNISAIDKLDDIGDVDVPTPNDHDVLAWDNGTSKWVAKNIAMLGPASVNVAGNDGDIQFRDGNDLGADSLLHWDNTNKRLGIGTATPTSTLTVSSSAVPPVLAIDLGNATTQNIYTLNQTTSGMLTALNTAINTNNMDYFLVNPSNVSNATTSNRYIYTTVPSTNTTAFSSSILGNYALTRNYSTAFTG